MSKQDVYEEEYELLDNHYRLNAKRSRFRYNPALYNDNDDYESNFFEDDIESIEEQLTQDIHQLQNQSNIIKQYTKNHALA